MLRLTENFVDDLNYFGVLIEEWNKHIKKKSSDKKYSELFEKIDKGDIEGRNLELFFPLFVIADMCGKGILNEVVEVSKEIIKEKKERDREENKDIQIYEFVAQYQNKEYVGISDLVREFKEYFESDEDFINSKWLGRGLKRLNLILDYRRAKKREIRLNIEKAREKIKMFKEPDEFTRELQEVLK